MLTKLLLEFPMSFSSQTQEKKSHKMTSLLLSILFLESIHHLTEDKSRQFCQNSNQQIACCSVCPRQSVSVTDKQSDGHSLNYCEKGRACNDPGPILDCSGCLVSFPQKHKDFFPLSWPFLYFALGRNTDSEGRPKWSETANAPTEINTYIITDTDIVPSNR